jgi:hypothetical protein
VVRLQKISSLVKGRTEILYTEGMQDRVVCKEGKSITGLKQMESLKTKGIYSEISVGKRNSGSITS